MANFARLMFTQQCSFNPKGLLFNKAPPSFQITTGIKKKLDQRTGRPDPGVAALVSLVFTGFVLVKLIQQSLSQSC